MRYSEFENPDIQAFLDSDEPGWHPVNEPGDAILLLSKIKIDDRFSQIVGTEIYGADGSAPADALADPVSNIKYEGTYDGDTGVLYDAGFLIKGVDGIYARDIDRLFITDDTLSNISDKAAVGAKIKLAAIARYQDAFPQAFDRAAGDIKDSAQDSEALTSAATMGYTSIWKVDRLYDPIDSLIVRNGDVTNADALEFLRDRDTASSKIADRVRSAAGKAEVMRCVARHDAMEAAFVDKVESLRSDPSLADIKRMKDAIARASLSRTSKVWVTFERGDRIARVQMPARAVFNMNPDTSIAEHSYTNLTTKGREDLAAAFNVVRGVGSKAMADSWWPTLRDATKIDYARKFLFSASPERARAARATETVQVGVYRIPEGWARKNLYSIEYGVRGEKDGYGPAPRNVFEQFNAERGFARAHPVDVERIDGSSVPAAAATFERGLEVIGAGVAHGIAHNCPLAARTGSHAA